MNISAHAEILHEEDERVFWCLAILRSPDGCLCIRNEHEKEYEDYERYLQELRDNKCPTCGHEGTVFIRRERFSALECFGCRYAWVKHKDGSWEHIVGQDLESLDFEVDGSMIIWDEVELC